MKAQKKIGFWSVTSLVAGSQIGSGIFLLPASLAWFGSLSLVTWAITATGAMLLALVFGRLCAKIPKTGGPHAYIEAAFGKTTAFYAAWTYWVISWLSSTAVVIAIIGYLTPLSGELHPTLNLILEIIILVVITYLNLQGVKAAGLAEFVFTSLKVLPLLIVPLAGLYYVNLNNFLPFNPTGLPTLTALNAASLLTLWGFIGVESATTPAEAVIHPQKTIPKAIITGTLIVALIYMLCSFVVMGIIPREVLAHSPAPFAEVARIVFGGNWSLIVSFVAAIICLGTLNAWVLTSGQIALGAANDGHFPKFFMKQNKHGAPSVALLISAAGMIPFLITTLDVNLISQVNNIIDISVTAFLFIYTLSVLSYLKIFFQNRKFKDWDLVGFMIGILALMFCGWALWASGLKMISLASIVTLTGLPIYLWNLKQQKRNAGQ